MAEMYYVRGTPERLHKNRKFFFFVFVIITIQPVNTLLLVIGLFIQGEGLELK